MKNVKKTLLLFIALMMVLLSGCSLPFSPSKSDALTNYIQSNSKLINSSSQLNSLLITKLSKVSKNNFQHELISEVQYNKNMQQEFYDTTKNSTTPYEYPTSKLIYLTIINSRIQSYDDIISAIEKDDFATFQDLVQSFQLKDKQAIKKGVTDMNQMLTADRQKPIKSL